MHVHAASLCFLFVNHRPVSSLHQFFIIFWESFAVSHDLFLLFSPFRSSSVLLCPLQGTVNNQTGIFPQSFVKIIKPLPETETEREGEGPTYSCLRCFLLTPSGVDTRYVQTYRMSVFCHKISKQDRNICRADCQLYYISFLGFGYRTYKPPLELCSVQTS